MPCKQGMVGCHRYCQHRQSVEAYRAARVADEAWFEQQTAGYDAECAEFRSQLVTFKKWLMGVRR